MKAKAKMGKRKAVLLWAGAGLLLVLASIVLWVWLSQAAGIQKIKLAADYQELFTEEQVKAHKMHLPEYDTDNTVGYLNQDGTKSLYIYASPIRYKSANGTLANIDTRLANVEDASLLDEGYAYTVAASDIVPLFPQTLTEESGIRLSKSITYTFGVDSGRGIKSRVRKETNFIGEKKTMVTYDGAFGDGTSARFYPSCLGINGEVAINRDLPDGKLTMWLQMPDNKAKLEETKGGYLVMSALGKNSEILAVIQKPLLKRADGQIDTSGTLDFVKQDSNLYTLEFSFDKEALSKGAVVFLSFEMRREKQPDNALYSRFPDLEYAYLRNYSVIGNSADYGIGQLLIRYKFTSTFRLKADDIRSASYYTYSLTEHADRLEMKTVLEDWCSMTGNWNDHYEIGKRAALLESVTPELRFDITDEVKMWCEDLEGQLEHNGLLLKSIDEEADIYNVLLSNDNTLYRNRTEVLLQ